jgi:hypothetical protein
MFNVQENAQKLNLIYLWGIFAPNYYNIVHEVNSRVGCADDNMTVYVNDIPINLVHTHPNYLAFEKGPIKTPFYNIKIVSHSKSCDNNIYLHFLECDINAVSNRELLIRDHDNNYTIESDLRISDDDGIFKSEDFKSRFRILAAYDLNVIHFNYKLESNFIVSGVGDSSKSHIIPICRTEDLYMNVIFTKINAPVYLYTDNIIFSVFTEKDTMYDMEGTIIENSTETIGKRESFILPTASAIYSQIFLSSSEPFECVIYGCILNNNLRSKIGRERFIDMGNSIICDGRFMVKRTTIKNKVNFDPEFSIYVPHIIKEVKKYMQIM